MFCKSCEPICEPEITAVLYHLENFTFSVQFTNLTKPGNKHCRALKILKNLSRIYLAVHKSCLHSWVVGGLEKVPKACLHNI